MAQTDQIPPHLLTLPIATNRMNNQSSNYRPDIDGLRALAVLPVIFFHAGFDWLSGGFLGVDIFFVISGFLITGILVQEYESGSWSLLRFYERRARRLLPALFVVILACIPFAWIWLYLDEFRRFGQSLAAVATFSANIYFFLKTDYFAPSAEEQPLLHTWSLAVEEQFYVLFPLLLWATWGLKRNGQMLLFFMLIIGSLFLAQSASLHMPLANFYLLPFRAWELLAGALLAMGQQPVRNWLSTRPAWSQTFSTLGLVLLVLSFLAFDRNTPTPSLTTVIPVTGTLLILATPAHSWVARLLSTPILIGIGLISYSAYLWHQPVIAFTKVALSRPFTTAESLALVLLSLVLAWATWKWVETPFRKKGASPTKPLYVASLSLALLATAGVFIHKTNGNLPGLPILAATDPAKQQVGDWKHWTNTLCEATFPFEGKVQGWWFCVLNKPELPTIMILGDSHANDLYPAFTQTDEFNHHTVLNIGTCTFLGEPKPDPLANKNGPCANEMLELQHHYLNDLMLKLRPHFVILNDAYPQDLTKLQADEYARRAKLRMELIESFGGTPVLMLPRPKLDEIHIRSCLGRPFLKTRSICEKPRELAMKPFENLTTALKAIKHDIPSLKMVSQEDYLCDSDNVCRFMRQGMPIIRDSGAEHYSEYGSRQFGSYVVRWAETELPELLTKSRE